MEELVVVSCVCVVGGGGGGCGGEGFVVRKLQANYIVPVSSESS